MLTAEEEPGDFARSDPTSEVVAIRSRGCPEPSFAETSPTLSLIASLPPILRTLLMTDGTVTRSLEAYFWEPVGIEQVALRSERAQAPVPEINVEPGEMILFREVRLVGQNSGRVFASAFSLVRLHLIPQPMREKLEQGGVGIGLLIRQTGLETYREILELGTARDLLFEEPELSQDDPAGSVVFRTYRILLEKRAAILITEKFPRALFPSAS